MQRIFITLVPAALVVLTACENAAAQQPPTISQMQGQCFSNFKQFAAQTDCITNAVTASGSAPNSYAQEYLAYMTSLQEKVKRKSLSENAARTQLTRKLNEVRALQNNEDVLQEQLANQRAAQDAEILRQYQYKAPQLEMPQRRSPILAPTTQTNCQTYGGQVNCTSRQ